jgi:hypothetical protein
LEIEQDALSIAFMHGVVHTVHASRTTWRRVNCVSENSVKGVRPVNYYLFDTNYRMIDCGNVEKRGARRAFAFPYLALRALRRSGSRFAAFGASFGFAPSLKYVAACGWVWDPALLSPTFAGFSIPIAITAERGRRKPTQREGYLDTVPI